MNTIPWTWFPNLLASNNPKRVDMQLNLIINLITVNQRRYQGFLIQVRNVTAKNH